MNNNLRYNSIDLMALVGQSKLKEVIEILINISETKKVSFGEEIISISAQFSNYNKKYRKGELSTPEDIQEHSKIVARLTNLIKTYQMELGALRDSNNIKYLSLQLENSPETPPSANNITMDIWRLVKFVFIVLFLLWLFIYIVDIFRIGG